MLTMNVNQDAVERGLQAKKGYATKQVTASQNAKQIMIVNLVAVVEEFVPNKEFYVIITKYWVITAIKRQSVIVEVVTSFKIYAKRIVIGHNGYNLNHSKRKKEKKKTTTKHPCFYISSHIFPVFFSFLN